MLEALRAWAFGPPPYRFDFFEARRRCRIVLIDDDPNALPLTDVRRDGYNIIQVEAVDANLLSQCESGIFDIIILDYNGIAPKSITPDDGFGIFDRIRKANPQQYIIAISAQTYDISKTAYFKNANDWLKKPTDLATTKDKIDKGIRHLFDKSEVLARLRSEMVADGFRSKNIEKIINRLSTKNYSDLDEINELVKRVGKVAELSSNVANTLKIIVKLAGV